MNTRILLADDHPVLTDALFHLLKQYFEIVGVAKNGSELISKAKEARPDVILMDISMPVMDGREFLRRKRSDPRIAEVPVIAISASSSGALEGVEEVLMKPDPIDAFVDAVRRHVFKKGA